MKKTFSKIAVAALVAGAMLTAGTANASTTKVASKHAKHAKHSLTRFLGCGSELECDGNGTASVVYRIFGVRVSDNGGVSNSNLCN
jgi:hypothetical protein